MSRILEEESHGKAARIAGIGYIVIIAAGIFAEFFVRSGLIVTGDAGSTYNNIVSSEQLFRIGIAGDLIMLISDVIVAVALYVVLKPVSKNLAMLAAFFRLVHSAVYGGALLSLFSVLLIISGADYLTAFNTAQKHSLVIMLLDVHSYGYLVGLVFFGFHCIVLGYLVYISGFIPRILGVLLVVAAAGYLVDSFSNLLLPGYASYEKVFLMVVFIPAFVGELSFCLWLIFKGAKIQLSNNPAM